MTTTNRDNTTDETRQAFLLAVEQTQALLNWMKQVRCSGGVAQEECDNHCNGSPATTPQAHGFSYALDKPIPAGKPITFRPDADVAELLTAAATHHPVVSRVINECCRRELVRLGYSAKKEAA